MYNLIENSNNHSKTSGGLWQHCTITNSESFNGTFHGTYVINLDDCKSIRTYWIGLHVNGGDITYFDSFGVQHM